MDGLSSWLMEIYTKNVDSIDWENTSVRKISTALGVSRDSAAKIKKYHLGSDEPTGNFLLPEPPRKAGRTHLVIGDAHALPGEDLSRFLWLGRMIRDLSPDVVICIGDMADMPALSSYDVGKRSFEGRRYTDDIEAANKALRLIHKPIDEHNQKFPNRRVEPEFVYCEGNHEHRIERAKDDNPGVDSMDLSDIEFEKMGWEVHRFLSPAVIDGVAYCHYFQQSNSARAISGVNAARNLLVKRHQSSVAGHSHLLQWYTEMAAGKRIHGLVCGCYFTKWKSYAAQSNSNWWAGICVLRDVHEGDYDLELWSMDRIKSRWG